MKQFSKIECPKWALNPHFWLLCGAIMGYILSRFIGLTWRPVHHDEGANGFFIQQIYDMGVFHYHSHQFHGPLWFYILFFFEHCFQNSILALRYPSALVGCMSLGVLLFAIPKLTGRFNAVLLTLLLGLSPGLLYYQRAGIHEALTLFLTITTLLLLFGWSLFPTYKRAVACAISVALLLATKETGLVYFVSMLVSLPLVFFMRQKTLLDQNTHSLPIRYPLLLLLMTLMICWIFYTGFGLYPQGFTLFMESFFQWQQEGWQSHQKPWFYFIQLLWTQEWPIFLGFLLWVSLLVQFFLQRNSHNSSAGLISETFFYHYLGNYGFLVLVIHSWIPYKTPWLAIQIIWPWLVILSAYLTAFIHKTLPYGKWLVGGLLLLWGAQSVYLNYMHPSDARSPYVYAQTTSQMAFWHKQLMLWVRDEPMVAELPITVYVKRPWPIPWMLAEFPNARYHRHVNEVALEKRLNSPIIIVDQDQRPLLGQGLEALFYEREIPLRPELKPLVILYNRKFFSCFVTPPSKAELTYRPLAPFLMEAFP